MPAPQNPPSRDLQSVRPMDGLALRLADAPTNRIVDPQLEPMTLTKCEVLHSSPYSATSMIGVLGRGMRNGQKMPSTVGNRNSGRTSNLPLVGERNRIPDLSMAPLAAFDVRRLRFMAAFDVALVAFANRVAVCTSTSTQFMPVGFCMTS